MDSDMSNSDERPVLEPAAVVEAFLKAYPADSVKAKFWQIFMGYSLGKNTDEVTRMPETEIALLFDDLVDLLEAIEALQHPSKS
jgi:hypothetical protein